MTEVDFQRFKPGDVLVVNASKGKGIFSAGWWIKLRSFLTGVNKRSRYADHVVIVHHCDAEGTLWGVEGKPSSVGWVDCALYLNTGQLVQDNHLQPKTDEQRAKICEVAKELLGTPYDWVAILALGSDVPFINRLWSRTFHPVLNKKLIPEWNAGEVPGHVICSSFAALTYMDVGLGHPFDMNGGVRLVDPDDWSEYIYNHETLLGWKD